MYDIIIIGSGAGGGVAADYLSETSGGRLKILILEAGPYYTRDHFTQRESDMIAAFYKRGALFSSNLHIGVSAGSLVGGSTAVYTGVSFRPPEDVLKKWRDDFGLDFLTDEFACKRLDKIESDINVHELPAGWVNDNNRLFKDGAESLGYEVKKLKINVKGCQQQGFCNLGCTSGGKQGTLEVQIPRALARGVEMIYNAKVDLVRKNGVDFTIRKAPAETIANQKQPGAYSLKAKTIIVAAGVLNTPALILKSQKNLGISNPLIGKYVTLHPAFNLNGTYKKIIKNYSGFPKTYYIDQFSDSEGYFLETSFYYPGVTAKNNPGFGRAHREMMLEYEKMMSILILAHDPAEAHNRIEIDKKGNPVLHYTVNQQVRESLVKALRRVARIFFAAGCNKTMSPGSSKISIISEEINFIEKIIQEKYISFEKTPLSSAHPQGGMRMGSDPQNSVTDLSGKLRGTDNIYIADASLFPTSVKVNPYETVMLLAQHVAEQVLSRG